VTLTTPTRGYSVIPRLAIDIFHVNTKFGDSRFSCSGDIIVGIETENKSCYSNYAPFMGDLSSKSYMHAKFYDSSFSRSRDIEGPKI